MAQNSSAKHMKAFWPLTIIFVVAAIASGLIYLFQFNLDTDYDLQSIVFSVHRRVPAPKTPAKKVQTPKASSSPATK